MTQGMARQLAFESSCLEVSPAADWCQRWNEGFHTWRRRSEGGFDASRYEVSPIDDRTAKVYI